MIRLVQIYEGPDQCPRCLGWGHLANDEDGTPWKFWAELPAPSNLAVTLGIVYPVACPKCDASGRQLPEHQLLTRLAEAQQAAQLGQLQPEQLLALLTEARHAISQLLAEARAEQPAQEQSSNE